MERESFETGAAILVILGAELFCDSGRGSSWFAIGPEGDQAMHVQGSQTSAKAIRELIDEGLAEEVSIGDDGRKGMRLRKGIKRSSRMLDKRSEEAEEGREDRVRMRSLQGTGQVRSGRKSRGGRARRFIS